MNILITGNLGSLAPSLAKQLGKLQHRLVLASDDATELGIQSHKAIIHSINPALNLFRDAMSSYQFDIVIFVASREEQLLDGDDLNAGHQLDGLWNTLELCKRTKLRRFFYISSTEVYGSDDDLSEDAVPHPLSTNGHTLLAGEQYCRIYHDRFGINTTILRLSNVYGPDEKSGLIYRILMACSHEEQIILPAREHNSISLLHVDDVVDFLVRAIDEEYTPDSLVVNLSSSNPIHYAELALLIQKYLPEAKILFSDEESYTRPVKVSAARTIYDWVDTHTLDEELPGMVDALRSDQSPKQGKFAKLAGRVRKDPELLKWVELIGGAAITQFLSQMTGTLIQFKYIDFRLLFVVIMGSIYGIRTGLYAAILVSISILYTWSQLGFDWALLIYNVGNWLPFALYFMAGLMTGYHHDKSENEIINAHEQTRLIYDKYSFLYGVFNDIRTLKDEFRERLLGYRDSFGKIFMITRELDQLQEQAVYLRALSILEEQMDNKHIAIYSLDADRTYARLEASSGALNGGVSRSLKLADYPEIRPFVEQGSIFQNRALLADYPAYVVPILKNTYPFNVPTAMIVIWSVKFEQYSTYYYNLLKVICGLIQASLVRATQFSNANHERMYLPTTRILNHQAFVDELKIRIEMRRNHVADFQLVAARAGQERQDIYSSISAEIRTTDMIGIGDEGIYYLLLSQADHVTAERIAEKLTGLGIHSRIVDANQLLMI